MRTGSKTAQVFIRRMQRNANREEQTQVKMLLQGVCRPWKEFANVLAWKAQYVKDNYGKLHRFKFLVLHGPSRLGKTQFALHLFGPQHTFYCNCQSATEPNLKDFQREIHKAIVLDEVHAGMVVSNKSLFQCHAEGVSLMESRCQQFATSRFLYQVALILCTNNWCPQELKDRENGDWLVKNSVVVSIEEPCWQE
jgi:hypothetical protein